MSARLAVLYFDLSRLATQESLSMEAFGVLGGDIDGRSYPPELRRTGDSRMRESLYLQALSYRLMRAGQRILRKG